MYAGFRVGLSRCRDDTWPQFEEKTITFGRKCEEFSLQPHHAQFLRRIPNIVVFCAFQVMSNGRYKSVEHRVFVSAKPRLSILSFNSPLEDTILCPIPELLQGSEVVDPKYKQCTFREYKTPLRELYT